MVAQQTAEPAPVDPADGRSQQAAQVDVARGLRTLLAEVCEHVPNLIDVGSLNEETRAPGNFRRLGYQRLVDETLCTEPVTRHYAAAGFALLAIVWARGDEPDRGYAALEALAEATARPDVLAIVADRYPPPQCDCERKAAAQIVVQIYAGDERTRRVRRLGGRGARGDATDCATMFVDSYTAVFGPFPAPASGGE